MLLSMADYITLSIILIKSLKLKMIVKILMLKPKSNKRSNMCVVSFLNYSKTDFI